MENTKNKNYIGIIMAIVVVAVLAFVLTRAPKTPVVENPAPVVHDDWETKSENGATFRYPADLRTSYITPTDWPPVLNVENSVYTCVEAGSEIERAGETSEVSVNGHTYCVTRASEGAAGSMYTQYAYARAAGDKTEILTFSLRFVQCGNYDEPNKTACESERSAFDITPTIDEVFETLVRI